jgi:hypothetical protein
MKILDIFGGHTITAWQTVETAYGPQKGPERLIQGCMVVEENKLVRDSNGSEIVSTAQAAIPPEARQDLEPGTMVRLPSGRETTIISMESVEPLSLPLPSFVRLNLA